MRLAHRLLKVSSQDHSTFFLVPKGYQPNGVVAEILAPKQPADLGREPHVSVRQSAKRAKQHLRPAPRWSRGRDIHHELPANVAQAPVDMGFFGELLFEQDNPHARQGSFQCVELLREFHGPKVRPGTEPRNLVVSEAELVRWCGLDSPCKTMDR